MIKFIARLQYRYFKWLAEVNGDYQEVNYWAKQIKETR